MRRPSTPFDSTTTRRGFLARAAGLGLAAGLVPLPVLAGTPRAKPSKALPFKISLAQWSLHQEIFDKRIDPLDFAVVANRLGFDAIEYVNQFYPDKAKSKTYLAELKRRAAGEGVWSVLIMIDREGHLGEPDAGKRAETVEQHKKWVEAAAYLGCHSIRVNAHSDGTPEEQIGYVADGLRRLTEFAEPHGINVIVENHGGLSSDASWLTTVMKKVDHPRCGTLPDFGNFRIAEGKEYDRYKGVSELMPFAKSVSAKTYDFDKHGNETTIDFAKMMKIVTDAGYHGYVGVEYEGKRLGEYVGIDKTKRLLERTRGRMTKA